MFVIDLIGHSFYLYKIANNGSSTVSQLIKTRKLPVHLNKSFIVTLFQCLIFLVSTSGASLKFIVHVVVHFPTLARSPSHSIISMSNRQF